MSVPQGQVGPILDQKNYSGGQMPQQQQQGQQPPRVTAAQFKLPTIKIRVNMEELGYESQNMECPYCGSLIATTIELSNGFLTYLSSLILFCCPPPLCCFMPCIPICSDKYKITRHSCPACQRFIGSYRRYQDFC